jgi:hypothetical protein
MLIGARVKKHATTLAKFSIHEQDLCSAKCPLYLLAYFAFFLPVDGFSKFLNLFDLICTLFACSTVRCVFCSIGNNCAVNLETQTRRCLVSAAVAAVMVVVSAVTVEAVAVAEVIVVVVVAEIRATTAVRRVTCRASAHSRGVAVVVGVHPRYSQNMLVCRWRRSRWRRRCMLQLWSGGPHVARLFGAASRWWTR